ncbi:hypothetical protein Xoosp13_35 [Xanthomonas phage Xoo-sp13]|nr:hypothetical protein Xoosp13_35 [Xanthomonas phage Xoo-sp13]
MARQPGIENRINEFLEALFKMYSIALAHLNTPNYVKPFTVEYGQKYARIVVETGGSRSVYCFVDLTDGSIRKAASWKSPTKGVRGSIWNDGCDVGKGKPCDMYGNGLYR